MDEVRVRLSAEGVQEVVNAVRKVATGSKAAATGADSAFRQLNSTLKAVKSTLDTIPMAFLIQKVLEVSSKLTQFGEDTIRAAVEQKDLAQSIGTTTSRMSALSTVAVLSKTRTETMVAGMGRLGDAIDNLRAGVPETVAAFKRLNLTAASFPSDDTALNAEILARALSKVKDGGTKGAIAFDILGKNGRALVPFFQKLVEINGLIGATNIAIKSGFYVGDIATAQLDAMDQRFKLLQVYAQGAVLSIVEGFGPSLVQVLDSATGVTNNSRDAFEKFGEAIGVVLRVARAAVQVGLAPLVEVMTLVIESTKAAYGLTQLIQTGASSKTVASFTRATAAQIGRDLDRIEQEATQSVADIFQKPAAVPDTPTDQSAARARQQQLLKARLAAQQEAFAAEVKLLQEKNKQLEASDARQYEAGLLSLNQYFSRRNDRINAEYAAELRLGALRKQGALAETDPTIRAAKLRELDADRQAREQKYEADQIAFLEEYRTKRLALLAEIAAGEDEVRDAQGRSLDSELRRIAQRETERRKKLVEANVDPAIAAAQAKTEADVLRAAARFKDLLATANRDLQDFDLKRSTIESDVAQHKLTALEGEAAIAALERERLPLLKAMSIELHAAADGLGPENQARVDQFDLSILKLSETVKGFRADLREAFQTSLEEFLSSGINKVNSLADAFRQLGLAIAASLQKRAASKLSGLFTDAVFKAIGLAEGGPVSGPGGPRSDSIPAMLSAGEYVMPANIMSRPGMLEGMEALRSGRVFPELITPHHRYADGGPVLQTPTNPAAARAVISGHITVAAEDGSRVTSVETPDGQAALLRAVGKNRRAINALLGH